MANYTTSDTEALVRDLKEFEDELGVPNKNKPSKQNIRKIRTLAEILNRNKKTESKKEVASNNKNVMDLDSLFKKVKSGDEPKKGPSRKR